jgi:putative transposase
MITILSTLASLLSFRVRSRASLELELIALRHQVIVLRRQRPRRLRLFFTDRLCGFTDCGLNSSMPWYSSNRRP